MRQDHLKRTATGLALMALAGNVACGTDEGDPGEPGNGSEPTDELEVNIQVTGAENLEPMIDELDERGILATVWLSTAEIEDKCDYVGSLASTGHEVAGKYPTELSDETELAAQRAELEGILEAASDCDARVVGFRASRFTANADTPDLLEELHYRYLERSAREEFFSVYRFKPYPAEDQSFAILPMPIMVSNGELGSMCDTSACNRMSASELLRYERAAINFHLRHGEPLIIEWHPELTHPDNDEGWWDTFLGVLAHLDEKGGAVRFVTAEELVERYAYAPE